MLIIVDENHTGKRADQFLSEAEADFSRSYVQKLIEEEKVTVNGKVIKSNFRLSVGDRIEYEIPDPVTCEIIPQDIPLDIVYEDEDILIVNKERGMVVHPAPGHSSGTLVNALMYHCDGKLSGINGELRPGIVHRIDKDTSGILVVCKNDTAHRFLSEQMKVHSITRSYMAVAYGIFKEKTGCVDAPIGRNPNDRLKMAINHKNGKEARTNYTVIEEYKNKYSKIRLDLETGRTHQIRVHMASLGHPLLGDVVYGPSKDPFKLDGQVLHAFKLGFIHPGTKKYVEFNSNLPEYFNDIVRKLNK